jgi:hypothetical protein
MTHFKSLLSQALVAGALLAGAGLAHASTYHVDIKTSGLDSGSTGYLDMVFASFGSADPVTATLSNLQGGFLGAPELTNLTVDANGSLHFVGALSSDYFQQIMLGQDISFDVSFGGALSDVSSAGFSADILNADLSAYLSNAVAFTLLPDTAVTYVTDANVATVSATAEVPEPSMLLSMFTGIGLLGLTLRRRVR